MNKASHALFLETTIDPLYHISPAHPVALRTAQCASLLLFLLPALALTTHHGVGAIEAVLLIAGGAYAMPLWRQRRAQSPQAPQPHLLDDAGIITLAFLFNLVVALLSMASTGFDPRFLENPAKMLVAVLATGLVMLLRPAPRVLWAGLLAGTVGAAGFAVYQRFGLNMARAEGFSMPITFGDLAMSMGLMSLAAIGQGYWRRGAALPYLAFFAGVVASILSGARGGWLALLLSFVPMWSYGRHTLGRRAIATVAVILLALAAVAALPQTGVRQRITDVGRELTQYNHGNPDSSVGARLEMWKGAWTMFVEHPLTGVGRANFNIGLKQLVARGSVDPAMSEYRHAHNEMLNALATQGLIGALALLAVYAAPLLFFTRALRHPGRHRPYALAGILLVISYIDFGLTQVMFAHHVGASFYALMVCTLAGSCLLERRCAAQAAGITATAPAAVLVQT